MKRRAQVLVTTVPFADANPLPKELLAGANVQYELNPLNRRLREEELAELVPDIEVLIAGTEPITEKVMAQANRLKLISRVGIGLDSVDLLAAERRGIKVSYTPDAPGPAVAELTIGIMLSLLRGIHQADRQLRSGIWTRIAGRRIAESTIGILGVGRIGSRVLEHLRGFAPRAILLNDIDQKFTPPDSNVRWASKEEIYSEADVITLHLPLTPSTRHLIGRDELRSMKRDAILINTARGGIVHERDLAAALREGRLGGAGIDVFEEEPYTGELTRIDRCVLTAHMGSMSVDCRAKMEIEATQEVVRYFAGQPLAGPVPPDEYEARRAMSAK